MTLLSILRTTGPYTPPDTTAPVPDATFTKSKISNKTGFDATTVTITSNENVDAYQIRMVPSETSKQQDGVLVEEGTLGAPGTSVITSVTYGEMIAAGALEGNNTLKVFVRDVAGNWSDPGSSAPPPSGDEILRPTGDVSIGAWFTSPLFSKVNEAITQPASASDTTFVTCTTTGGEKEMVLDIGPVSAGRTASQVKLWALIECSTASSFAQFRLRLRDASNALLAESAPFSPAVKTWVSLTYSNSLTEAQLNGLRAACVAEVGDMGDVVHVYNVYAEVSGTASTGSVDAMRPDGDVTAGSWAAAPLWSKLNDDIVAPNTPAVGSPVVSISGGAGKIASTVSLSSPLATTASGVVLNAYVMFDKSSIGGVIYVTLNVNGAAQSPSIAVNSMTGGAWFSATIPAPAGASWGPPDLSSMTVSFSIGGSSSAADYAEIAAIYVVPTGSDF